VEAVQKAPRSSRLQQGLEDGGHWLMLRERSTPVNAGFKEALATTPLCVC
jgi:hypothetical protein